MFLAINGNIMQTEQEQHVRTFLHKKSIEFGMALKYSVTSYKQETEIFPVIRPPTCWKPDSCFWFVRKDKKGIKAN